MTIRTIFLTALATLLPAAQAAADVVHVFECHLNEGASALQVIQRSADWLKAARAMPGGEDIQVSLEIPMAAESGVKGFNYVVISPNLSKWGEFYDNYEGSGAAAADVGFEAVATCGNSSLFSSIEITPAMSDSK